LREREQERACASKESVCARARRKERERERERESLRIGMCVGGGCLLKIVRMLRDFGGYWTI
jgi:hypothetical protein